jgi:cell division protein FtsZ
MPRKIKKNKKIRLKKKTSRPVQKAKTKKIVKPPTGSSLLEDKKSFLKGPIKRIKIRVIGIGGGGSSIVSEIAQKISLLGKEKISFVVANTDLKTLRKTSLQTQRFPFGQNLTFGLGTGMNPQLGRLAAQKEKEKIQKILEGEDLIIFVASLGGGVGSGATPIFAKISQDLGILTYGFFTLPFKFEGEKKMEIAKDSLRKLKPYLNALSIIPNERIFQVIDKKTPLTNALSVINKTLAKSLEGLLEIIYQPGLINIDFADLRTILAGDASQPSPGKISYLNTVEIEGQNKVQEAIKNLISSPLYPYSISGAEGVLFNISGDPSLKLTEVNEISQAIWELSRGEPKIIFGISENRKLKDKLKITLLATDCKANFPISRKKQNIKKIQKEKIKKHKIKIKPEPPVQTGEDKVLAVRTGFLEKTTQKIRRNALQARKALQEEEENILAQEKIWETPTFLRKKLKSA